MKTGELFKIDSEINEAIINELGRIEKNHNIDILFAIESGSRAWGFPSVDSDYDIRFIYKRSLKEYLSVKRVKDTLTFPVKDDLDICGWDIKKVLQQILKSNSIMYEWFQSPVVYRQKENLRNEIWNIGKQYFSPHASLSHYLGICKKYLSGLAPDKKIKIKRIFYVLRPLFAAKWICGKKTIPPVVFQKLIEIIGRDKKMNEVISRLLDEKLNSDEKTFTKVPGSLLNFILAAYDTCENRKAHFDRIIFATDVLDEYFYRLIGGS